MQIRKKFLPLLFFALLISAVPAAVLAMESNADLQVSAALEPAAADEGQVLLTCGTIISTEQGVIVVQGEGSRPIIAADISAACLVNGRNGTIKKENAFKVGKKATVYYSPKMTRSIPPQAQAFAVVLGDYGPENARFFAVAEAAFSENGSSVEVLNSNRDLLATIDKYACKEYKKITAGTKLLLWYEIVAMSLPGRTHALKARILPENNKI